jgi:hypothetical protein
MDSKGSLAFATPICSTFSAICFGEKASKPNSSDIVNPSGLDGLPLSAARTVQPVHLYF